MKKLIPLLLLLVASPVLGEDLTFMQFHGVGNTSKAVVAAFETGDALGGSLVWRMPFAGKMRNLHVVCEHSVGPETFTLKKFTKPGPAWTSSLVSCTIASGTECEDDYDDPPNHEMTFSQYDYIMLDGDCGPATQTNATAEVVTTGGNPYTPSLFFGTYGGAFPAIGKFCNPSYGNSCEDTVLTNGFPMTRTTSMTNISVWMGHDARLSDHDFVVWNMLSATPTSLGCTITTGVSNWECTGTGTAGVTQGDEYGVWYSHTGLHPYSHNKSFVISFSPGMGQLITARGAMWSGAEDRYINAHETWHPVADIQKTVYRFPRCATVQRVCASKSDASSDPVTVDVCVSNSNPPDCLTSISVSLGAGVASNCNTIDTTPVDQGNYYTVKSTSPGTAVGTLAVSFEALAGQGDAGDSLCAAAGTATPTPTQSGTPTLTPTITSTPLPTNTPTITGTPLPTNTPTITPTVTNTTGATPPTTTPTATATPADCTYDLYNRLPTSDALFLPDARNFMCMEDANRFDEQFHTFIYRGGFHGPPDPAVGLAFPPGNPTSGTVAGWYVLDYGTIVYPNNTYCWVIMDSDDRATDIEAFDRVAGTHYLIDCRADPLDKPDKPIGTAWLMRVRTQGGAITETLDLRSRVPWGEVYQFTAELPATDRKIDLGYSLEDGCFYGDTGEGWTAFVDSRNWRSVNVTQIWDPPSIPSLDAAYITVTMDGVALGDKCMGSHGEVAALDKMIISAYPLADDTVKFVLYNGGASPLDLASGTVYLTCWK